MRKTSRCPKCQSRDIVHVPGRVGAYGSGNNILVGRTIFSAVKVSRYLCAQCGYTEEWIDDPKDIARIKAKYAS